MPAGTVEAGDANRFVLVATIAAREPLRYTPAGVPVIDLTLAHRSEQIEAKHPRRVELEMRAVALGEPATRLASVTVGTTLRCQGFLARRYRTGTGARFHITEFELS